MAAERPKLSPHKPEIRRRVAELLGVADDAVNVKAKTGERVGWFPTYKQAEKAREKARANLSS